MILYSVLSFLATVGQGEFFCGDLTENTLTCRPSLQLRRRLYSTTVYLTPDSKLLRGFQRGNGPAKVHSNGVTD